MFIEDRIQRLFERRFAEAGAAVRLQLWNGRSFDLGAKPRVTLKLNRPTSVLRLLRPSLDALGEAYVEGGLDVEGPLDEVLLVGEALSRSGKGSARRVRGTRRPHRRRLDRASVGFHYDLSNEFYALWLDRNMVYSCAYFRSGDEDIHAAQEQKLDLVCRKLMLEPGDRLLDVGCGWGALIRFAARRYGVRATGITLSRNQYEYAAARIREEGLEERCEVQLRDYRDLPKEPVFDKIASIGMVEHVGLENLPAYFGSLAGCLRGGGLLLNHGIASADPDHAPPDVGGGDFIERNVFPHTDLPHVGLAAQEMARRGLEPVDVESLRPHYATTLRHWVTRLDDRADDARRLVGDKRYRIWRIYMAGSAHAFERGWISVYQTVALKPARTGRFTLPWTRDHLYAPHTPRAVARPDAVVAQG